MNDDPRMNAQTALGRLTVLAEKAERYEQEVFFRETWPQLDAACTRPLELAFAHGLIVFKPDAFAARAVLPALDVLERAGFAPAASRVVQLDRHTTRWLWLYRFNVASAERVWLHDLINSAGPSLLVLLHDELAAGSIPATVRLTAHKGPSRPERRRPDQLRSLLGVADRLLNYMHTSDEPADMVRELGILLPAGERRILFEELVAAQMPKTLLHEQIARLEAAVPAHPLTLAAAVVGVAETARRRAAFAATDGEAERWRTLARCAQELASDRPRPHDGALATLWRHVAAEAEGLDRWDVVSIGTWAARHDEPGVAAQVLGDAPEAMWARALERVA